MVEMKAVMKMAFAGEDEAPLAMVLITLLMAGALAKASPSTRTRTICIEKPRRAQTPPAHPLMTISRGLAPVAGIAPMNTMMVRTIQKMYGSGNNLFTRDTHPFVNFLNIESPFL